MNNIDCLLEIWNNNLKKDWSSSVCFFPDKETRHTVTRELSRRLLGTLKTHKTALFDDGLNHIFHFYVIEKTSPPIGVGGFDNIIFYDCNDPEKLLFAYISYIPTVVEGGKTIFLLPEGKSIPNIFNNEYSTLINYNTTI